MDMAGALLSNLFRQ